MAAFSYTYTFTNGSTADATQVNQNFSDVKNGVTDGTKDINVNAITAAGTSTLNGSLVFGNSSTPTVTWNASLASSIPVGTNTSYDIGSATLGLRSVYIGGTSTFSTRIIGAATATWTLTLPTTAGTGGNFLQTDGSGTTTWANISIPGIAQNLGLAASVATNALTVALKNATGSDPSSSSPVTVFFRNATAATGQYASVSQSAALSIVVPSTATLGQTSNMSQYVWVYLVNDAGVLDLAVSGVTLFDDSSTQSMTQISAAATSGSVLYSGSSHTGAKPIKLIGRLLVSEATAGTWASAPSEIALLPVPKYNATDWTDGGVITIGATTTAPTKASGIVIDKVKYRRDGKDLIANYAYNQSNVTSAAVGSGDYKFLIPNSYNIDLSLITVYTTVVGNNTRWNSSNHVGHGNVAGGTDAGVAAAVVYDANNVRLMHVTSTNGGAICSASPEALTNTNVSICFEIRVPIAGWSPYGP